MRTISHSSVKLLRSPALVALALLATAACREAPDTAFGELRAVHAASGPGATPVVAIAPDGRRAMAWIA